MATSLLQQARFTLACLTKVVRELEALGPAINPPRVDPEVRLRSVALAVTTFLASQNQRVTVHAIRKGVRVRAELLNGALALLRAEGIADWEPGPRNAKLWCLTNSQ